jgi:hypothetical protein
MESHDAAAVGRALPRVAGAGDRDLLGPKARLIADHGAGAALALQTMTHRDARRLAFDRQVKLPATAGGRSTGHD